VTDTLNVATLADNDFRKTLPRYQEEFADNNAKLVKGFAEIAAGKNCSSAQLALAWVLAQGEDIIPIPGTKKRKYLEENAGAIDVTLSIADLSEIDGLVARYPDTGERYSEGAMKMVNN
jgi:aryl-alcohol dehydrogenase-like predicted oxidoreductase